MITTEAWVLYASSSENGGPAASPGSRLRRESYAFPDITDREVLAEPVYGCWEGNMTHACQRDPIDICSERREAKVVIGNAGVVRILKTGATVSTVEKDDLCLVFCTGVSDRLGYPRTIYAYDAPGTVGLLARQTKLQEHQLIRLPANSQHSPQQWAAFSLRYVTAWANWKVAHACWRGLSNNGSGRRPFVWGWGGGVSLAELTLARSWGCRTAMIASADQRLGWIEDLGVKPIDRRQFGNLDFDEERYSSESAYRKAYLGAEARFLGIVDEMTGGSGVDIFVDFIGLPVFRATLKALARPGVVTTAGWKKGMNLRTLRALECMNWHTHVHTHYARYPEGLEAVQFAESSGWMPMVAGDICSWDDIPQMADAHARGGLTEYFPIFQVNPL